MDKKYPEFEDIFTVEKLKGCDYSAYKSLLAWSSTQSEGIVLQDIQSGEQSRIAEGDLSAYHPVFSPEDNRLLYLTQIKEKYCMMIYSFDKKTTKCVWSSDVPITDPLWSPDGKYILYASVQRQEENTEPERAEPVVIDSLGYKFDGIGFRRPSNTMQLFVLKPDTGWHRCITSGMCDFLHHTWCQDSEHIVCISNMYRSGSDYLGYDLLSIQIHTGKMQKLTEGLWLASYPSPVRPVCTPDGQYVIAGVLDSDYAATISTGTFPQVYLYRIRLDGTLQERIFYPDQNCYQCVQFPYNVDCGNGMDTLQIDEKGKFLFFHSGWQGQGGLFRMNLTNYQVQPTGRGKYVYKGISRIRDGKMVVARCSAGQMEGYYLVNTETCCVEKRLVQSAEKYVKETIFSSPVDFTVPTNDGTDQVHGWLLPPIDRDPSRKYPLILYIHGGPHPFYTYALDLEMQAFAAQGFAVLYCNPRGSSGYGWFHQNWGDARCREPFEDCMSFVDAALRRFLWLDKKRMGVTGGSYGGYMTNYIATHSERFRAFISQRGVFNDQILYASSDETGSSAEYNDFRKFMQINLEKSAVSYVEKINAPFLILHGTDDCRTPVEGAVQMYHALKDVRPDLPVKMVLYPNTGHSQPRERSERISYYKEMLRWFNTWLKDR